MTKPRLPRTPKRAARRRLTPVMGLTASIALCSFLLFTPSSAQQPASDVAIDNDDIGGVVTGPKGPEAGVWVIAETRDLPVRYIKSVVTDDRGRFVVPDLPPASYQVWARGYGLVDSAKATAQAGPAPRDHRDGRAERGRRRALLPGDLLVLDAEDPRRRSVRRQEQHPRPADADQLDQRDEEHRLHRLPSARPAVDAHDSRVARHVRVRRRGVAAARAVGPVGAADARPADEPGRHVRSPTTATGPIASPRASCRLPSRRGRKASSATSSSRCATG